MMSRRMGATVIGRPRTACVADGDRSVVAVGMRRGTIWLFVEDRLEDEDGDGDGDEVEVERET
jgi:hypothetical protein